MIAPTPEASFILLATRAGVVGEPSSLRVAASAVRDWHRLVELAHRHRVQRYVLDAAQDAAIALPEAAAVQLRAAVVTAVAQAMSLDHTLERLAVDLASAGVPVVVLKGPALARTVYPEARLRPYDDLDLVVPGDYEAAAVTVFAALGFAERPYAAEEARRAHAGHLHEGAAFHRVFVAADGVTTVELHLDSLQLGLRAAAESARWARTIALPGVPGARMLGVEDQVVQLSVHAQKHGYSRLIWLKDLDVLVRAYAGHLDWRLVRRVAAQEGAGASVWYGLLLAARLLRTPVPRHVRAMLRPPAPVRALYRLVWPPATIADLGGVMRRRAVQFHAADSWRGMVPGLLLMGRRRQRIRAIVQSLRSGRSPVAALVTRRDRDR